jgi:hypothetical protein
LDNKDIDRIGTMMREREVEIKREAERMAEKERA